MFEFTRDFLLNQQPPQTAQELVQELLADPSFEPWCVLQRGLFKPCDEIGRNVKTKAIKLRQKMGGVEFPVPGSEFIKCGSHCDFVRIAARNGVEMNPCHAIGNGIADFWKDAGGQLALCQYPFRAVQRPAPEACQPQQHCRG